MNLLELRKQWGAKLDKMQDLIKLAEKEGRGFNATEIEQYDQLKREADELEGSIERAEDFEKLQARRGESANAATVKVTREHGEDEKGNVKIWRSLGEQLLAVANAGKNPHKTDQRLHESEKIMRAATGLNEAVGQDGGFLVQNDFAEGLLQNVYETGILASRVKRIGITRGNGISFNIVDDTSRVAGSRLGGIQAFWENEGDLYIASKPKFRQMGLQLKKLTGLCYVTEELLEDTNALEAVISKGFTEEFGYKIDEAILFGSGAGQPLGIMNSGAVITVAKDSSQAADSVTFQNIINMRARLWARSRPNAVWLINADVEAGLFTMSFQVGTNTIPVYLPAGGASHAPYDTLFGLPVLPIEQAKTVGDVGDVILVDPSQYILIDKGQMQKASSVHVRFLYDEMTYKFTYRVDGQPIWNAPMTPANGPNTTSPFVAVADRA